MDSIYIQNDQFPHVPSRAIHIKDSLVSLFCVETSGANQATQHLNTTGRPILRLGLYAPTVVFRYDNQRFVLKPFMTDRANYQNMQIIE
jgi:hypothetical protein